LNLSCRQESSANLFWPFPAGRKTPQNFFELFLRAGKLGKSFLNFSCVQEDSKKVWGGMDMVTEWKNKTVWAFIFENRTSLEKIGLNLFLGDCGGCLACLARATWRAIFFYRREDWKQRL
jgi:hypothetical protein